MGLIASVERQLAKCTPTGCSRPVQTTSLPLSKLSLFTSPFCPLPLLGLEQALRGRFGRNCHPCCTDEETEFSRQGEPCPRSQLMRSAMVLRPGPSTALLLSTGQSLCCLAWHLRLPRIWLHLPPRSICQHAAPFVHQPPRLCPHSLDTQRLFSAPCLCTWCSLGHAAWGTAVPLSSVLPVVPVMGS